MDFNCYHCGRVFPLAQAFPCPIDELGAVLKALAKVHARCKPGKAGEELKARRLQEFEELRRKENDG